MRDPQSAARAVGQALQLVAGGHMYRDGKLTAGCDPRAARPDGTVEFVDADGARWVVKVRPLPRQEETITIDCPACGGAGWLPSLPEGQSACGYCRDGKIHVRREVSQ